MKSSSLFLMSAAFLAGAWWTWSSMVTAAPPATCEDGPVPAAWPVGESGFDTPRLLSAHGQYQQIGSYAAEVHRGVDVAACEDDVVYAVEDGVVDYVYHVEGGDYNQVYIADADEVDVGWSYLHLKTIDVVEGDTVQRDQAIGTVAAFGPYTGFEHVHLERIVADTAGDSLTGSVLNAGDPLLWLAARKDGVAPKAMEFGSPVPAVARFRFFEDSSGSESATGLALDELVGKKVDVIARLEEVFPGPGPSACTTSVCDAVAVAHQLVPRRISFSILLNVATESGGVNLERKFHNVIDLQPAVVGDTSSMNLAEYVYREDSVGTYDEREFLVELTNCQTDGEGSFEFEADKYTLQLVLEDASGNVGYLERTLDLH